MNDNNKLENLTLVVIKIILAIVISLTIISAILEISFSKDILGDSIGILGMNLLDFAIIFLLFIIPVSRSTIMIVEFSKSGNQINAVSEVVVLGIILGLVARIII